MSWRVSLGAFGGLFVLGCSICMLGSASAFAGQNPYSVCIGDDCNYPTNVNLNCSFAAAHANDIDEQAAKLVCTVQNNYTNYNYVRNVVTKGGRCGTTYVQVRCTDRTP
jgi:hypothetical protein